MSGSFFIRLLFAKPARLMQDINRFRFLLQIFLVAPSFRVKDVQTEKN